MTSEQPETKETEEELRNKYVKVYDNKCLSYQHFVRHHLIKNEPAIIKNVVYSNGTDKNWKIYDKWIKQEEKCVDYKFLENKYGDKVVNVAYCGDKSYSDQKRESMKLKNYLKYLQNDINKNDDDENYQQLEKWLNNMKQYKLSSFDPLWTNSILYCKDWHIVRELKEEYYKTPSFFADDWLNYYWDKRNDNDYKFCYFGPKYSWTPLHHDVYLSYSWSTNIIGKKLWILFNPNESKYYLKNTKRNEWIYNLLTLIDNVDGINDKQYPNLHKLFDDKNKIITSKMIIQNENEAIFIPSGWFHEVYNLDDIVLSINHNWFNGFNINLIWECIYNEYQNVCQSIDDLRDIMDNKTFYQNCQQLLMEFLGIDFNQFIQIILTNVQNILEILKSNDNKKNESNFKMKSYLFSMKNVLNTIEKCIGSKCMNQDHIKQLQDIKQMVTKTLLELQFIRLDDDQFWPKL